MNLTVLASIISKLDNDATLKALLGRTVGDGTVFRAQRIDPALAPCITVEPRDGQGSLFPGACFNEGIPGAFISDENPSLKIGVWVSTSGNKAPKTGDDADLITDRVDFLLRRDAGNWVKPTHGWRKMSAFPQFEDATQLWHNTLNLSFRYHVFYGETIV